MSIALTRDSMQPAIEERLHNQHVWPLRVTAVSSESGLSSKIFVYHAAMDDDGFIGDVFECIASVPQMSEIPEDAPVSVDGGNVPYFRTDVLTFNCRSEDEADDLWAKVKADVTDLVQNFRAAQRFETVETVTIDPL